MRKTLQPMSIALVFIALLFCGCLRAPSEATLSRLAVVTSNQEAKRLYHVEPFRQEHGQLQAEGGHLVWEGLTTSSGHDMVAKVTFDEKGTVVSVNVRMLANPISEPVRNRTNLFAPDKTPRIPEVMPK